MKLNLREKIDRLEKEVADQEFLLEKANADFHQMSMLRKMARKRIDVTTDKIDCLLSEIDGLWELEKHE